VISLNKIFLLIFTFIIFTWLIFTTFLNDNFNKFEEVYYKDTEKWTYSLDFKENQVYFNSWSSLSDIKINYLNSFDKILEYKWKINIKNDIINLEKWVFLINFSELNNSYDINWEWFNIKTNWPQTIFIDNSWVRTNIFSINSKLELNLINTENEKIINTVYLYPHKYIKFIPSQNKNIENADLLKLTQRFPLEYFPERILLNWKFNENIIKKVIWNKNDEENENIKNMFMFLYLNNKNWNILLKNFEYKKFGILIWEKFIKEYNKLFLNESKQIVYYKNLIIRTIWELINSKWQNNSKNQFLIDSLNELKILSEKDYLEMKKILDFYSNLVINWKKDDINSKISFSKINNNLENREYKFKNEYLLNLSDAYFKYDFLNDITFYNNLTNINKNIIKEELNENQKSYFIFYINKTILSWFDELSKNNLIKLDDILSIFNDYTEISIPYYSKNDNIRIRTWIEEYNEILKKLEKKIKEVYFEEKRDNKWLLILNKSNNLSIEKINTFDENRIKIFKYFNENNKSLWDRTKDDLIKKEFIDSKKIYDEYILAIRNYDSYIASYSEENKALLFWETANEKENKNNEISIENALKFLSQFNYLETIYSKISLRWYNYCNNPIAKYDIDEINEPYCYKIEKMIIWSNMEMDMILIPSEYNNISNFSINWDKNKNKWSYKLDNEKIIWDETLKKKWSEENTEKYKFENFFLYVFNPPIDNNQNINNNNPINSTIEIEESLVIKIFKRNKLLWESWDFKNLEWFIDIKYEDLIVKENWNNYDIKIRNARLWYSAKWMQYVWVFNSKYNFLPDHSFIEPEIIFFDNNWNELFNWNSIKILWVFNVKTIKNDLFDFFDNLNYLQPILNTIKDSAPNSKINIEFERAKNNFIIKNDKIKIITFWTSINSINHNWKELLELPINIFDLEKFLKLIK